MARANRIGDILLSSKLITDAQLEQLLKKQKSEDGKMGELAVKLGMISEGQLLEVLEKQTGCKRVNLYQYQVTEEAIKLLPEDFALQNNVLPLEIKDKNIVIATNDPLDYFVLEDVRFLTGMQAEVVLAPKRDIKGFVRKHYSMTKTIKSLGLNLDADESIKIDVEDEESANTPIGKFVDQILSGAVAAGASDIHLDANDKNLTIRYRVDGVLRTEHSIKKSVLNQIVSKIKVMAKMRIQETRRPQDGRIKRIIEGKSIDLRISTLPTIHGEKVVIRILELDGHVKDLKTITSSEKISDLIKKLIKQPNGILLVAGPTGSGKTTTLYSCLNTLNDETVNIVTVEDPVELQINGINQVQVQSDIDLTFANALRSILRQDPNVIMIGEIRDFETAQIATRAALTGHLVLSTIHTNDAVKTIARLMDMGVEPFLVASSLNGVVSQRLVRKVCKNCGVEVQTTKAEQDKFAKYGMKNVKTTIKAKGCSDCNHTGYKGRTAIFEVLEVTDELKRLISKDMDFTNFAEEAMDKGLQTLEKAGLEKVIEGVTTLEEVVKVCLE